MYTTIWELIVLHNNNEPRHVISTNVAFLQVYTCTSSCSLFLNLQTPNGVQSLA